MTVPSSTDPILTSLQWHKVQETKPADESKAQIAKTPSQSPDFYDLDLVIEDKPDPIGFCSISTTCASCSCSCSCATCGHSCPWC